ncbi:LuxR C-terminal-related transcriptional regulator [Flavobacterium sp.]|uniref:LuxR C-terminal-related transcriptional regulator n=1 Tax=Flavobacterium sp. TaxID=239 RepID=UPI003D0D4030
MSIAGEKKILIADDHMVVCRGIEAMVKPAFENPTFFHVNTMAQLLAELSNTSYDALLLDVNYTDANLTDTIALVKEKAPESKIFVFTSGLSFKEFNIIKKYANAILTKQSEADTFVATIDDVFQNGKFVCSPLNEEKVQKLESLTERELDILECMLDGMGNKEMVYHLDIKESTISTLRKRILEKLDLTNNVELLNYFTESVI